MVAPESTPKETALQPVSVQDPLDPGKGVTLFGPCLPGKAGQLRKYLPSPLTQTGLFASGTLSGL